MAKVLVVDDSRFMRMIVKEALRTAGHEVIAEAEDGFEGVYYYKKYQPDLVTMDITMRDKDGLETIEEIMSLDPYAKIVMVTALGQENLLFRAIRLGIKDFVVKPFNPERLQKAAERALS